MRKWINSLRAYRDRLRIATSRRRYDQPKLTIERVHKLKRVVFIRWDAKWGDSVVFSFVPRVLKAFDPAISVEVVTTPEMAPLFQHTFHSDIVYETSRKPSKKDMKALADRIGEVDLAVFFSHLIKHRDIYFLRQLKTKHIASLDDSVGLVDLKLGEATRGRHMADKYLVLLERCGINQAEARYLVPRNEEAEARVDQWLSSRRPMIAFNAFSKGRARTFTPETSERLIRMLLALLPEHYICVMSVPGRQGEVERLCAKFEEGRVLCLQETRSIHDNIALLVHSKALISAITATVHLADGLDVPSFVLFPYDPADKDDWHSRHPDSSNLLALPGAPLDVNRLDWKEVEQALEAFLSRLNSSN